MRRSPFLAVALAALASLTPLFAADLARLERFPNERKYSDKAPYEQAASTSASVQARALLDANGNTYIEVTTGQLDVPNSSTGTLERVTIKYPNGKKISTRDYDLGDRSTFYVRRTGLTRGMTIQIQAHVRPTGENGKEVFNLTTTVRLRPDVEVTSIDVPPEVEEDTPVSIVAVLTERNGDTGARTTCALLVDGRHVDTASNIWVDAGDTVSCLFSTSFSEGSHQVRVIAQGVTPGDWSLANNEKMVEVTAGSKGGDVWSASASQQTKSTMTTTTYSNRPQYPDTYEQRRVDDKLAFNATIDALLNLDNLDIKAEERTDGQLIQSIDPEFIPHGGSNECRMYDGKYTVITVCPVNGKTTINMTRGAGEATYISKWWGQTYDRTTGQTSWEQYVVNERDTYGNPRRYGSTVTLDVSVSDGTTSFHADPYMMLETYEEPEQVTSSCRDLSDGTRQCSETRTKVSGKRGSDESN